MPLTPKNTNSSHEIQVLTAGGAGSISSKGKLCLDKNNKNSNTAVADDGNNSVDIGAEKKSSDVFPTTEIQKNKDFGYEYEESSEVRSVDNECNRVESGVIRINNFVNSGGTKNIGTENEAVTPVNIEELYQEESKSSKRHDLIWLFLCFLGIMASFVCYGLLLEYTTSGGRKLHELSFLFVTSGLYTLTAAAGRYVRGETLTTIPPSRFAVLGLTSMGSTFTSVRSLRYVIYPIQVLAKSCKPVPVMLMGTLMGKRYDLRKYINVVMIVIGVAFFMGGSDSGKGKGDDEEKTSSSQIFGIFLLFISLCFDGGTGAYEDKLMSVHSVQPFDLMYNIQLGKTILAGVSLLVLNQLHIFIQMCQEMGPLLIALGLSGAMGQVFIFVTISKFGALTCSIIGLARKITTLLASIYFYGHHLNGIQVGGLVLSVTAMVMNFMGKSKKGGGHGHNETQSTKEQEQEQDDEQEDEELRKMLNEYQDEEDHDEVELVMK